MKMFLWKLIVGAEFIGYLWWQLILANLRVTKDILMPLHHLKPRILAYETKLDTDEQITMLSNLITLTPGTLTLDISTDKKIMFIHVLNVTDVEALHEDIRRGFERRVKDLLS